MIALARLGGIVSGIVFGWPRLRVLGSFSLIEPGSIARGLGASVLFAAIGATVFQVGPGEPPASGSGFTVLTAVPIQGMVRRETTIASLEQALSSGKASQSGLPADSRARILELGQGER